MARYLLPFTFLILVKGNLGAEEISQESFQPDSNIRLIPEEEGPRQLYLVTGAVDVRPQYQVVKEGDSVTVLCQFGMALEYCRIVMPDGAGLSLSKKKKPFNGTVYFGEGLDKGQCGARIESVKASHNGVIKCVISGVEQAQEIEGLTTLVVMKQPMRPQFENVTRGVDKKDYYKEGNIFSASCIIRKGRPYANISWYLDDQRINEGLSQLQVTKEDKDLYTVSQTIRRSLQASDNGKYLKCVAQHPLLTDYTNTTSYQLNVRFGPKARSEPFEHFGLVEGEDGRVSVLVMANPQPKFVWRVGEESIREGSSSGRFEVEHTVTDPTKGPGNWISVLVISSLTKEDVETTYNLDADNGIGKESYTVRISTSQEPKRVVDLGAGTIAGIVIAALVVILLVIILVFARAKGRWCFAGDHGGVEEPEKVGQGTDNPAANHNSSEYINTSPDLKKPKEDTPV